MFTKLRNEPKILFRTKEYRKLKNKDGTDLYVRTIKKGG